jgi:hypothetical protein
MLRLLMLIRQILAKNKTFYDPYKKVNVYHFLNAYFQLREEPSFKCKWNIYIYYITNNVVLHIINRVLHLRYTV